MIIIHSEDGIRELPIDPANVSDGFHNFPELYEHRCTLFALCCDLMAALAWKSRKHHDGSQYGGWFIAGLELPQVGTITYHLPDSMWDLMDIPERELAPEWDGHTSQDVVNRMQQWLKKGREQSF